MDPKKKTPKQGKRIRKTRKQDNSQERKVLMNPKRDRSQGRGRLRSQSRENTKDVENNSEKALPSAALFSRYGHLLLLDEPEEQTEVQTPPSRENPAPQTKTQQLEADLAFERAQVQKLQEKLAKKEAKKTVDYQKMESALKKAEDLLETERLSWQQEKSTLLEQMEKSRALYEDRLDKQKHENNTLVAALRKVEQKLESHQVEWQEEKTSLIQATEGFEKTVQDMQQEAKRALERSQASHQAQLEEHKEETRKIISALQKAEDLLETERLSWQQEKTTLLEETEKSRALYEDRLDEQKHENSTLVAALRNVEQKLESHHVEWQEEKTSLIQATEGFKKTVQDMQQEAKEALERSQASHQAELEEHKEETRKITYALQKAEDLLETERLGWQQEKSTLLEEITSFIQVTGAVKETVQEIQQETEELLENNTSQLVAMKSQLEELTSKKNKKKKWYRRFF